MARGRAAIGVAATLGRTLFAAPSVPQRCWEAQKRQGLELKLGTWAGTSMESGAMSWRSLERHRDGCDSESSRKLACTLAVDIC